MTTGMQGRMRGDAPAGRGRYARHPAQAATMMRSAIFTLLVLGTVAASPTQKALAQMTQTQPSAGQGQQTHPYVGMWVTADGRIRHNLLPNGRYDEARGSRESAYQGRYEVRGNEILYWDDTGFTADGIFVEDDVLHHGGMILYRRG